MAGTRSQSAKLTLTVPLAVRGQPALVMQRLRQAWRRVPVFSLMILMVAILCALFALCSHPMTRLEQIPLKRSRLRACRNIC
jgi:hypothetical protein